MEKEQRVTTSSSATVTKDYFHQIATDETTEHISLGEDFGILAGAEEPEKIVDRLEIKNRTCGRRMQLFLYEEGFLRVREWQRKKKTNEYLLGLRFLKPSFSTSRYLPMRVLHVAAGLLGVAVLSALVAWLSPWSAVFVPVAVVGGTGALIAAMLFLYLAHEKTMFETSSGHAIVLTLLGTADALKRCRSVAPKIVAAIERAHASNIQSASDYLRQEMREHYRLREVGVIDHDDCSLATRQILSRFG